MVFTLPAFSASDQQPLSADHMKYIFIQFFRFDTFHVRYLLSNHLLNGFYPGSLLSSEPSAAFYWPHNQLFLHYF